MGWPRKATALLHGGESNSACGVCTAPPRELGYGPRRDSLGSCPSSYFGLFGFPVGPQTLQCQATKGEDRNWRPRSGMDMFLAIPCDMSYSRICTSSPMLARCGLLTRPPMLARV